MGNALQGVDIQISFLSFRFGDSIKDRPYIQKDKQVSKIGPKEIGAYLPMSSANEEKNSYEIGAILVQCVVKMNL